MAAVVAEQVVTFEAARGRRALLAPEAADGRHRGRCARRPARVIFFRLRVVIIRGDIVRLPAGPYGSWSRDRRHRPNIVCNARGDRCCRHWRSGDRRKRRRHGHILQQVGEYMRHDERLLVVRGAPPRGSAGACRCGRQARR